MQADERQLITDLFERMRSYGPVEKDHEAENLIMQLARQHPDAGYMLVQSVLVQEQALAQSQGRIEELEAQVRQLQTQRPTAQAAQPQAAGGSFLGGLFGGSRSAPTQGSVPAMGRQAAAPSGPWGAANANSRPVAGGQSMQQPMQQAAPAAGGGFMRSAMATAAGVAGGMLAANAISGMLGGHGHGGSQTASNSGSSSGASEAAAEPAQTYDDSNNDPGNYTEPAVDDSSGWDGGGDVDL